ncbi:MAG: rod shape-determining protein [Thermoanaerobaculia bacterium]|nr:rod shape-determining protein [Thermoanaerobaculia bacterium]MDX9735379.1 rod shape-determining protein [Thermoanaerobaculia bacterium]HQP88769.1 rod shape-determining protein [Thermoanaerobaculia bacterium]
MGLRSLFSWFSSDLAVDLGTANTLVFAEGRGIVVREPSIVAVNRVTNRVEAVGGAAKEMLGRTPGNIVAIRPMKDGVIADFEITEKMLDYFIKKAIGRSPFVRPRIVISVPSDITQVEKRAVKDSALQAGASEVFIIEQAMAAAIGSGLPITEPTGNMIVDIGGGTTDVAVISLAGIVYSKSVRVASNEMDEAIIQYIKRKYNLLIGERTAEQIKIEIGSAFPLDEPLTMEIKGRDLVEGIPKTLTLTDAEVRESLAETVGILVDAVRVALEKTPPELSADIMDKGIVITGGGSLLKNLDRRLREETGLPITIAELPLDSVALGTGAMLADVDLLRKISVD